MSLKNGKTNRKDVRGGKPQGNAYIGNIKGSGPVSKRDTTQQIINTATPDRYKTAKDPLRKAIGAHASLPITPLMASKYIDHPNAAVSAAAKRLAGRHATPKDPTGPGREDA